MTLWHYQRNCAPHDCVDSRQLKQLAAKGELQPDDLVRQEGTEAWVPARKLKGLYSCDPVRRYIKPPEGTWERRTIRALEQEKYDAALRMVTKVLTRQPEHAQATALRGGAYLGQGDGNRARADFERAHKLDPENAAAWGGFAALATMSEDWQECVRASTQAALRDPDDDKDLLALRGLGYFRLGEFDAADDDLDRVLTIDPRNIDALLMKMSIAQQRKDWEICHHLATKTLKIDPDNKYALQMRSHANFELGDRTAAKADANQAFEVDPDDINSLGMQASIELQHKNYRKCDALATAYLEHEPDSGTVFGLRGLARFHLGDLKASASDINKAIKLEPDESLLWGLRAGIAQSMGDTKICIRAATEALKRGSDSLWVRVIRGNALIVEGNMVSAEADFDACLQTDPTQAYALLGKAVVSMSNATAAECRSRNLKESHLDHAGRYIRAAKSAEPGNPVFEKVAHAIALQWEFLEEQDRAGTELPPAEEASPGAVRNFAMEVVKDIGIQIISSLILPF